MTAQSDPYVRVYYRIIDDPKFADVYDDKATLGTWLTLLIHADALHPAPATLPQGVRRAHLDKLVKCGLIDLIGERRYRMHGLAAEREKRAEAARFAADVKHHGVDAAMRMQSERNADAVRAHPVSSADGVPLQSDPLRTDPIRSSPTPAGAKKSGSKDPSVEKAELLRRLDNPATSAGVREAIGVRLRQIETAA